ncbi:arylsulfotransferase family protein [Lentzea sp. E54]|uniref:arylsulfotransferase family protein n=1 Tax=Lentzea xerophila TaxID=3435883 RepID=UPI003DA55FD5
MILRRKVVVVVTLLIALAGSAHVPAAAQHEPDQLLHFVTRPDLKAPRINVRISTAGTAPGYVFLGPKSDTFVLPPASVLGGPEIVDNTGQPVWFLPRGDGNLIRTAAFEAQSYRGRPVLTWWEGLPVPIHEIGAPVFGNWVIMDESYRVIDRVKPGNGMEFADMHDMRITPWGTALILVYRMVAHKDGDTIRMVHDNVIQEVRIGTREVLFEWSALDHIGLDESTMPRPDNPLTPYGAVHLNSLSLDTDGNIITSGRHTSAVYKIDRTSGEIIWRLGGKRSDFTFGPGAAFAWQHDAARERDGTLSVFDNASTGDGPQISRGLLLNLDEPRRTATLARSYPSPDGLMSGTQGSVQELGNGNVFVGWGSHGTFTEFSQRGEVVFNASFAKQHLNSYRAFRLPWVGKPTDLPVAAGRGNTAYASWNGATEVVSWRVLAGAGAQSLAPVATAPRRGFETSIPLPGPAAYLAVQALDRNGSVLGTSRPAKTG